MLYVEVLEGPKKRLHRMHGVGEGGWQGMWGSRSPKLGEEGFHPNPKESRKGPRTKHMRKHTCKLLTPYPAAREEKKSPPIGSTLQHR